MRPFISIKWKFLAVCLAFVTLPAVFLGVLAYNTFRTETLINARRDLTLIASGWQTVADVYYEELSRVLKREQYLVEKRLESITLDTKKMIEFYDENFGLETADPRFNALLDKLSTIKIGRSGYVFLIDQDGKYLLSHERKLDRLNVLQFKQGDSPAVYKEMLEAARKLNGDETKVFHYNWTDPGYPEARRKVAVIAYIPKLKIIVAASAYYTDFKSYELERVLREELKQRMAQQRIGEHGYVFVLNTNGEFVVSKDRLRDGENVYDYQDQTGYFFIRDIIERGVKLRLGESFLTGYWWKNLDDDSPSRKIAAIVYYPGWDWIIGASAYEDDFLKGLAVIRWQIIRICFVFTIIGSVVAFFFATHITWPIRKLEGIATEGNLNASMDRSILESDDEIGTLGKAFEKMMKSLREKIAEIEQSRQELLAKNVELQRAQKQLVQSEKLVAIGQLAAGVAHEINNPLAYVMSNMETLEHYIHAYEDVLRDIEMVVQRKDTWRTADDAQADVALYAQRMKDAQFESIRRDIQVMLPELQNGLNRVRRIVLDLRTFAHSEQERKIEVAVEDILEQVITIVWNQIRYQSELIRDYSKTPFVHCHAQKIGQVLMNIILNASQAVEPGKGVIRIRTYADAQWVYVEVSDNGSGIPEQNMVKIFEPFFTTKAVGKGTGLGLSISYEIIKKHNGEIRVTSQVGKGSTFTVLLPIHEAGAAGA